MRPPDHWTSSICFLLLNISSTFARHFRSSNGNSVPLAGSGRTTLISPASETTSICDLTFDIASSQLTRATIDCRTLYNNCNLMSNSDSEYQYETTTATTAAQNNNKNQTENWTFYETIGGETYLINGSITITPTENTIENLELCFTTTINALHLTSTSINCLTLPEPQEPVFMSSSSAGMSHGSSNPEGFVLAFTHSSFQQLPLQESSSAAASTRSSVPEGFVFAFTETSDSSNPSTVSSVPEGFVFAFHENQSSSHLRN